MTRFITDFADQFVVLPLAAVVALALLAGGWRRGAAVWTATVGGALGLMLVLKLVFAACGHLLLGPMLHSPSGHTASAAVVYGGLVTLLTRHTRSRILFAGLTALGFAAAIGLSRLELRVHTILEVIAGGAVGVTATIIMARLAGPPPRGWHPAPVCLAGALVLAIFHGRQLPAEVEIDAFAALDIWPLSACHAGRGLPAAASLPIAPAAPRNF
jgi:membrane-associated phospholipid phosphatase